MQNIPEIIAAFAFFGAIFICPLVYMLMKHQRAIAEVIHAGAANEAFQRLEILEREVQELKAARLEEILRQEDQRELSRLSTDAARATSNVHLPDRP